MRLHAIRALAALTILAACSGSGTTGTITVLGYTVQVTTAPPSSALAGTPVPIAFTIFENESDGTSKPASGKSFTVTVTAGGGTVGGSSSTTLTSATDGTVSFTWTLGSTLGTQTLRGSVSSTEYLDVSVTATAAPATQLGFATTASTSGTVGVALAQQPAVQLKNASGGSVSQSGVVVTATIGSGGGTIGGTTTATTNASGVATFTNLSVAGVTGPVTLSFSASLNGTTASVASAAITIGAPQLVIVTQPAATATSGVVLTRQPTIQLKDASGTSNIAQAGTAITASVFSGGGTLTGTTTATTDASGLATFTDLTLNGATGSIVLKFAATVNGQAITVNSQALTESAPNQLTLLAAPGSAQSSTTPFLIQPVIQLRDGAGNALQQGGVAVTVSRATGIPALGLLPGGIGSLTVNTDATGRATFHDLMLSGTGSVTLQFTAPGISSVTTGTITVANPPIVTALVNAAQIASVTMNAGDINYYTFTAPAGTLSFDIAAYQGLGNVELYVRRNVTPTATDFDCAATVAGPSQICTFTTNLTTPVVIALKAVGAVTGERVRANAYNANCNSKGALAFGVQTNGTLAAGTACTVEQNLSINDRYTLVVPTDQALSLTANSGDPANSIFIAYRLPGNQLTYWAPFTTSATVQPLLFGAGTYDVLVGDNTSTGATRTYAVKFAQVAANTMGCSIVTPASAPLTITLALNSSDCAGTTAGTFSRRAGIILGVGQSVTITMSSTAFDPLVKMLPGITTGSAAVLASDNNSGGGTTARLTFTNTDPFSSQQFTIELTSAVAAAIGNFTVSLTFGPAFYQSIRPLKVTGGQ